MCVVCVCMPCLRLKDHFWDESTIVMEERMHRMFDAR